MGRYQEQLRKFAMQTEKCYKVIMSILKTHLSVYRLLNWGTLSKVVRVMNWHPQDRENPNNEGSILKVFDSTILLSKNDRENPKTHLW